MAILFPGKMKSGLPGTPLGRTGQPRKPARTRAKRNDSSVVLLPVALMARMFSERDRDTDSKELVGSFSRRAFANFDFVPRESIGYRVFILRVPRVLGKFSGKYRARTLYFIGHLHLPHEPQEPFPWLLLKRP